MPNWLVWLLAFAAVTGCLALWFKDVKRIMQGISSTVESAAGQLSSSRRRVQTAGRDPEADAVLARSENIYRQAVDIYNRTIRKPWILLPALLMGFGFMK